MKKIPYKTIVLVLLSLGNIIVLILSSLSLKNINGNKKNTSILLPTSINGLTSFFDVKKGNLQEKISFNGQFVFDDSIYQTYNVDSLAPSITCFSDICENTMLGIKSESEVLCNEYSKIMSIEEKESEYIITTFQYNHVYVNITLSYNEYYGTDFASGSYFITMGKEDIKLQYNGVDFSNTTSSSIDVKFVLQDNKFVVSNYYNVQVYKLIKEYKDVFYIDDCSSISELTQKTFFYSDKNNMVKEILIFCEKVIGNHYIISADNLFEGLRIYDQYSA